MTKQISKSIAMALAAITLSLPFSTQALAASHQDNHPNPGHKTEWRHDQHRDQKHDQHHEYREHRDQKIQHRYPAPPQPKQEKHHSATGNFVTGAIIGGILGAIIAKNS